MAFCLVGVAGGNLIAKFFDNLTIDGFILSILSHQLFQTADGIVTDILALLAFFQCAGLGQRGDDGLTDLQGLANSFLSLFGRVLSLLGSILGLLL